MAIGDLFKKVTGKSPAEYRDLIDVERAAQEALGKPLVIESFKSDLVPKRGNIFHVAPYHGDLDADVEAANRRIGRICQP